MMFFKSNNIGTMCKKAVLELQNFSKGGTDLGSNKSVIC